MQIAGIDWDFGNWPKCGKHGVGQEEIEFALFNMDFMTPDAFPAEERYFTANKLPSGRYVFIVFTFREKVDGIYFRPISARYMHRKEIEKYEKFKAMAKTQK